MSLNSVRPFLSKTELQRDFQTRPIDDPTRRIVEALFDMLDWQRGEDQIQASTIVSLTASQTTQPGPSIIPIDGEEWELIIAWLTDTSGIDVADTAAFMFYDTRLGVNPINLNPLSGGAKVSNQTTNYWMWPNLSANFQYSFPIPMRIRKLDQQAATRRLATIITTTATAGTRNFQLWAYVKRRPI
jgi:hypothetical protein